MAWLGLIMLTVVAFAQAQTPTKQGQGLPSTQQQMSMGVLAITSNHDGTLFVDGERKVAVATDKVVTVHLTAGQHFVDLRDTSGAKLWEKVVDVPAGAQVAERISAKTVSIPPATQRVAAAAELTPCEENQSVRQGSGRRHSMQEGFLSRICGVILVPGVVPSCDKGQFP